MTAILDPRDAKPMEVWPLSTRPKSLAGRTVGVRYVVHREDYTLYSHLVAQALQQQFQVANIVKIELSLWQSSMTPEELDDFSGKVDAAIVGVAGWGQSTNGCIHDATELERRGTPSIVVVTEAYQHLSQLVAASLGYPELAMVTLPSSFEVLSEERVKPLVQKTIQDIVKGLTRQG